MLQTGEITVGALTAAMAVIAVGAMIATFIFAHQWLQFRRERRRIEKFWHDERQRIIRKYGAPDD